MKEKAPEAFRDEVRRLLDARAAIVVTDGISMNRERLMADAKSKALERVREGYRAPAPRTAIPVGGESVTEQTALAVIPQRPPGPLVVMMFTAAGNCAMALRKSICCWLRLAMSVPLFLVQGRHCAARWIEYKTKAGCRVPPF